MPGMFCANLFSMTIVRAHVEGGRLVVDDPTDLPEGTKVDLAVMGDDDDLSPEERAEMLASIDRGLEQAARGEGSPAEDVLRRLRAQ
jgi:hypothetical protein